MANHLKMIKVMVSLKRKLKKVVFFVFMETGIAFKLHFIGFETNHNSLRKCMKLSYVALNRKINI